MQWKNNSTSHSTQPNPWMDPTHVHLWEDDCQCVKEALLPQTDRAMRCQSKSWPLLRYYTGTELRLLRSTTTFRCRLKTFLLDPANGHQETDWRLFCDAPLVSYSRGRNTNDSVTVTVTSCTTNPQQIEVMELEHYGRRTCSTRYTICARWVYNIDRSATARRPSYGQQARPSMSLLTTRSTCRDENFLSPNLSQSSKAKYPLIWEI